ncbi:TetR/AcrR family transcriptional regulator [Amycolatopsis sp. H20-H5]|uniref:TetR/AcrR family transcriptional regulator n=1 Tax=Amycolatopsis sp. H20-H5 TaxID=3046309 RepID=UPI002DC0511C|nr:TetR/AcrR family transcriptional regulator [Amycolatopsis sp. H20-H5]MEC3976470.1 TetR/AcrR family transcriptional regulator [Amycolatopsis sp. H20-H5]
MSGPAVSITLTPMGAAANVMDMASAKTRVPFAEAAKVLLRETLLDAAGELLRTRSWQDLKMADIAATAGVSRQTLYKEFGSRQGFAQVYILREADVFLSAVERAVAANRADPRRALAAAIEVFLTAAAEEPLIKAIVAGDDSDGLLSLVTNHAGPVLAGATERLTGYLIGLWPGSAPSSLALVAQYLVRLGISHAASPQGTPAETGAEMALVLGPYLDQVVDTPP